MKKTLLAGGALALALAGYFYRQNNALQITRHTLCAGLPRPVRLLQVSDLHGKQFGPAGRDLLRAAQAERPHLIVLTGDTVSADCRNLRATARLVARLCAMASVFLIPGNHERRSGRWEEVAALFGQSGAIVLENERFDGSVNGVPLHILGLAEPLAVSRLDYVRAALHILRHADHRPALQKLAEQDGLRIVLSHFPENFSLIGALSYDQFPFDLMLSGHAHGGQARLPFFGGLFAPGQGLFPRFTEGLRGHRPALVISRGLGNDSPFPRVNNRPELVTVTFL